MAEQGWSFAVAQAKAGGAWTPWELRAPCFPSVSPSLQVALAGPQLQPALTLPIAGDVLMPRSRYLQRVRRGAKISPPVPEFPRVSRRGTPGS